QRDPPPQSRPRHPLGQPAAVPGTNLAMPDTRDLQLSSGALDYTVVRDGALRLARFGLPALEWAAETSGLFGAVVDGQRIDARAPGLALQDVTFPEAHAGSRHTTLH